MRLTLRTLLAYMDDILDPSDQEELARKIEASPFATELIHRSRDAVRRLRLSAPEVLTGESGDLHGGDHNMDANTAAEYLDNTLSPDEVADFERNCLEAGPNADMLLAEAASCHHILTLVLGEPAEVDADLRQRMYALVRQAATMPLHRVEPAHVSPTTPAVVPAAALAAAPPTAAAITLPSRPAVDPDEAAVPDYLLEASRARRRSRRFVAMMVVCALLGSGLTLLFWPGGKTTPPSAVADGKMGDVDALATGDLDIGEPEAAKDSTTGSAAATSGGDAPAWTPGPSASTPAAPAGEATTASAEVPIGEAPPAPTAADIATANDAAAAATVDPGATPTEPSVPPTTDPAAGVTQPEVPPTADPGAVAGTPAVPPATPTPPTGDPAAGATSTAPAPVEDPNAGGDLVASAGTMAPPADALPPAATDAAGSPVGETASAGGSPADPTALNPETPADPYAPADPAAPVEPEAPRQLGTYLGLSDDLLLRFDADAGPQGGWLRLPPRSTFMAGDRVLTLPAFRTHVVLHPDVNAYLGGGTEIVLLRPDDAGGATNIAIPYGQLILNSGPSGNRVALAHGEQTRVITLGPSSSLAIEVRRTYTPGINPQNTPAPLEVSWYLTSGKAEWDEDPASGLAGQTAEGPATWTTSAAGVDAPPQAIDDLPEWIDKEPTTTLEARARDDIAETVAANQPVNGALLELTTGTGIGRRVEVRQLAARGASYVGEFEPLVKALADLQQKAKWDDQVAALRDAIARDPANVDRIHAAFALQRGEDAADELTEMVVGFSPESIGTTRAAVQEGSMLQLINWLNDDDLTFRVLASLSLDEITGMTGLGGYRPEQTESQRRRAISIYSKRFDDGELMPKAQ